VKTLVAFLFVFFFAKSAALPAAGITSLRIVPPQATLTGAAATQQVLAVATDADGTERDVTAEAEWRVSQPEAAKFVDTARISPLKNGTISVTATFAERTATSSVRIADANVVKPIVFTGAIAGLLTKRGCNGASCHGGVKGQGGLKLSASGLYPAEDYEWLIKGGAYQVLTAEIKGDRVPRIDLKNPEKSLLLLKPAMAVPHGGGKRFDINSDDYNTVLAWIRKGAPFDDGAGSAQPRLTRLEVFPPIAIMPVNGQHGVIVTAHFSDGHTEDYTREALYSLNAEDVATIAGTTVTGKRRGETAMVIRAGGHVASIAVGVIGNPVESYPKVERSNFIDEHVLNKLRRFQIVPSEVADDSEFLRRVCLDLTGTLPPPNRVREFLASRDPRKREKVIDVLIGSPEFVDYWTFRFAEIFRVAIFANGLSPKWSKEYWEWIRSNVERNRPWDEIARERISAQGYSPATRHFLPYNQIALPAEAMAEEVRVFTGRRLDCAQCHNHPYENWSQDQFWGMAAFFSRLFKVGPVVIDHPTNLDLGSKDVGGSTELLHPRTKAPLTPALLDNASLAITPDGNPRKELARWMTSHPYFAEAAVNRMWSHFFGRGIVNPVDDFRSTNPATHPELLAALAADFQKHGYDLRHLMRTIAMSRTYQTSHSPNATNRGDVTNYSRALARGLDAEVLLDAVADVTGLPETFTTAVTDGSAVGQAPFRTRAIQLRDPDTFFSRFLELYGRSNRGAIPERNNKPNLGQALHTLAGATYVNRLSGPNTRLERLLKRGASDDEIFEEFYQAALSRPPAADELQELRTLLTGRGDRESGLREFVWALVSSREFAENH
jgi:hypothetical protein